MSNEPERRGERQRQVDDDMATADRTNGERPPEDEHDPAQRLRRPDPEAPGTYVDDEDAAEVAEPNEPA